MRSSRALAQTTTVRKPDGFTSRKGEQSRPVPPGTMVNGMLHSSTTYIRILALASATVLYAADEQKLALTATAQAAFEHVPPSVTPDLRDTAACVQAQAALLPIATPDELPAVHFR